MTYGQQFEQNKLFRPKSNDDDKAKNLFNVKGSHGANNKRLAQLLATWDIVMDIIGWDDIIFTEIVTEYQASLDAKYHDDYKAVLLAEEIDKRLSLRRQNKDSAIT